jgi:hypothetical protein
VGPDKKKIQLPEKYLSPLRRATGSEPRRPFDGLAAEQH